MISISQFIYYRVHLLLFLSEEIALLYHQLLFDVETCRRCLAFLRVSTAQGHELLVLKQVLLALVDQVIDLVEIVLAYFDLVQIKRWQFNLHACVKWKLLPFLNDGLFGQFTLAFDELQLVLQIDLLDIALVHIHINQGRLLTIQHVHCFIIHGIVHLERRLQRLILLFYHITRCRRLTVLFRRKIVLKLLTEHIVIRNVFIEYYFCDSCTLIILSHIECIRVGCLLRLLLVIDLALHIGHIDKYLILQQRVKLI